MAKKRAKIEPERLGNALRGRDVLIPESSNGTTPQRQRVETPKPEVKREPTTVRFNNDTVKALLSTRSRLLVDLDLKASQSDIVEAAVLRALSDFENLAESIQALQEGTLRVTV